MAGIIAQPGGGFYSAAMAGGRLILLLAGPLAAHGMRLPSSLATVTALESPSS